MIGPTDAGSRDGEDGVPPARGLPDRLETGLTHLVALATVVALGQSSRTALIAALGLAQIGERMVILLDIESLLMSPEMCLID